MKPEDYPERVFLPLADEPPFVMLPIQVYTRPTNGCEPYVREFKVATTPPDFTEQARQLVKKWRETFRAHTDYEFDALAKEIASFASSVVDELSQRLTASADRSGALLLELAELRSENDRVRNEARIELEAEVRLLKRQNGELKTIIEMATDDDPGTALSKLHKIQHRAATAALEQAVQWQPIETAPKDKTVVLVALIKDGKVWRVSEASFNGLGWYDKGGKACHWRTHWIPLPPIAAIGNDREQQQ